MFVVPVKGDKILTKDDSTPIIVSSFSNLKEEPAIYVMPGAIKESFIFFSDIVSINGVRVEYDDGAKLFKSIGPLRRKFNLPQPKDIITIKLIDVPYKDETEDIEVIELKLHNKRQGISKGLLTCGEVGCFNLEEILNIERVGWSEIFNQQLFKNYYLDYFPF